jgi:PAS domain S-box-containing protein
MNPAPAGGAPVAVAGLQRTASAPVQLAWHTLPHGEFDYVNDDWCAYTGLDLARSSGDGWQQALHPDDLVRWKAAWEQGEGAGHPHELRYRLFRADGVYGWFLSHVDAIRGEAGEIAGWMGTATVTDDAPSPELQEKAILPPAPVDATVVHGKEALVAAAVHDLKNELTVIRGTAQVLERHLRRVAAVEPERVLTGLAQIQRSTTKMHKLVEEFFDLSRLQSDLPVEFNRQPTDLVALARGCVSEYGQTTSHDLTLSTTAETLIGNWDAARLERVLANILSNASKYSAPATAIHVSIGHDDTGRRDVAVLTVRDQGAGVPAQDLPHIFEPFYRGSNVIHQVDGTGIGLFGARAIVEQQGGTFDLESTEGMGTTVTVRLPLTA